MPGFLPAGLTVKEFTCEMRPGLIEWGRFREAEGEATGCLDFGRREKTTGKEEAEKCTVLSGWEIRKKSMKIQGIISALM